MSWVSEWMNDGYDEDGEAQAAAVVPLEKASGCEWMMF